MVKKTEYRTAVLNYLKKHPGEDISRDVLIEKTGISRSRLSEVLHSIRQDGYTITTPPRSGRVRLESEENQNIFPAIKDSDIRQWTILFLLSRFEKLTFNELLMKMLILKDVNLDQMKILIDTYSSRKAYSDAQLIKCLRKNTGAEAKDILSVTALRNDLADLRKQGLVVMRKREHTTYQLTAKAPCIIPISADSLYEFCLRYEESATATTGLAPLKQAYAKIQRLIQMEAPDSVSHQFGKTNEISQRQLDSFEAFTSHDYRAKLIQLESAFNGVHRRDTFAVGLLFYSVETGCFYALGKNLTANRIESRRLDWVDKITTLQEPNTEYHQKKYSRIYSEMFSSAYESTAYKVKILFQDFGNVTKRFSDLQKTREHSVIRPIEDPPEGCIFSYIYEDTVRGLYDLARYLRGFGTSVLAMEPPALTDKMLYTYNRIIEKYEERHE